MLKASYWQRGETLDFLNETGARIEAGTIVTCGSVIGIAGTDINPSEVGSLHVQGVYRIAKADDSDEIAMGTVLYLSDTGVTSQSSDATMAGYAAEKSVSGEKFVAVKINSAQGQGGTEIAGPPGESAYQTWLKQPGNERKSEEEFLQSLKGDPGEKGDPGDPGEKGDPGEGLTGSATAVTDLAGTEDAPAICTKVNELLTALRARGVIS